MFLSPQYAVLYNVNIYLNFTSRHVVFFGGGGGVGWNRTNSSLAYHFKSNRKSSRESHATSYDCLRLLALLNYSLFL